MDRDQNRGVKSMNKSMRKLVMDCLFPTGFEEKVLLLTPVFHKRGNEAAEGSGE